MSKYLSLKAYGDTIGPLGFRQSSAVAKATEEAMKRQPSDLRGMFKTTVTGADGKAASVDGYARFAITPDKIELSEGEHADVSIVTSDAVDKDREVVLADGGDFVQFLANPVVPFNHDYLSLPVGRCLWLTRVVPDPAGGSPTKGWKAKTRYTPRPDAHPAAAEWTPDTVWHFVQAGDLRGKSIGFMPMSIRQPTRDEIAGRPDWKDARHLIDKWILLEYSPCPIPCNSTALVEAVAKAAGEGVAVGKQLLDAIGAKFPHPAPVAAKETIVIETKDQPEVPQSPAASDESPPPPEPNEEAVNPKHEHSSTQFDLPPHVAAAAKSMSAGIKDEHLHEDGREPDPHLTLHYGLHTEDPEDVRKAVAGVGPVTFKLGKVRCFPASEKRGSDVVHMEASGHGLHALKKRLTAMPHSNSYPDYDPHVTLAYCKPGMAKDYDGMEGMEGLSVTCSHVAFSDKSGKKTMIPLTGEKSVDPQNADAEITPAQEVPPVVETKAASTPEPIPAPAFSPAQIEKAVAARVMKNMSAIVDRAAEKAKDEVFALMGRP